MVFTDIVTAQAAWMGVPFVNSSGCGVVRTPIPHAPVFSGLLVRGLALLAPRLRGTEYDGERGGSLILKIVCCCFCGEGVLGY